MADAPTAEREHCQFYPHGDCARPVTHEYRHKSRPTWVPVCEKHAQMASELYGGQTRPLGGTS